MGHLQKVTRAAADNILEEIDRDEHSRDFNPEKHNIDRSRTHLNVDLSGHAGTARACLDKRLSEIKVMNRADIKVLGQWVWTVPKDLPEQFHKDFFQGIYDFYAQKYGPENIAYARVHYDETSPHIHVGIIPVVKDKNGVERCRAKDVFTHESMTHAHSDLQKFLENRLGTDVNLINGASLGAESIDDFRKAKDLAKQVQTLQKECAELSQTRQDLQRQVQYLKKDRDAIQDEISEKKGLLAEIKNFLTGHPNYFQMFLHWLGFGREMALEKEKQFHKEMDRIDRRSRGGWER